MRQAYALSATTSVLMFSLLIQGMIAPAHGQTILKDTISASTGQTFFPAYRNLGLAADYSVGFQPLSFSQSVHISSLTIRGLHLGGSPLVNMDPLNSGYRIGVYSDAATVSSTLSPDLGSASAVPQVTLLQTLPSAFPM
jgi:hypothetical protein